LNGAVIAPKTTVEQLKSAPKVKTVEPDITATSSDEDDMAYFSSLADD
jgi:hypothetical protein